MAVSHAITYVAHAATWHFDMRLRELSVAIQHLRSCLADDDEAHDDSLLGALVDQEVVLGQLFHEATRISRSLLNLIKIIG
jgi:hypothetical protein